MSLFSFNRTITAAFIVITTAIVTAPRAVADDANFDMSAFAPPPQAEQEAQAIQQQGMAADRGQITQQKQQQNYVPSPSRRTSNLRLPLAVATRTVLSQRSQKLPVTNLDSFVYQSGMSDSIYGDEGMDGLPPMMGMDESHTIGSGISSGGLTTGHSSNLPSAWCTYE
jgi:hypothetical protein